MNKVFILHLSGHEAFLKTKWYRVFKNLNIKIDLMHYRETVSYSTTVETGEWHK